MKIQLLPLCSLPFFSSFFLSAPFAASPSCRLFNSDLNGGTMWRSVLGKSSIKRLEIAVSQKVNGKIAAREIELLIWLRQGEFFTVYQAGILSSVYIFLSVIWPSRSFRLSKQAYLIFKIHPHSLRSSEKT